MPHIHTDPGQHDLTTTAFIIRTTENEPLGLFHKHRKLGVLLPVGGHVELNENPWAAAIHEIKEESGYDISQLKVLQPHDRIGHMDGVKTHPVPLFLQTHEYKSGVKHYHVDVGFLLVTSELPMSLPNEGETVELIWLSSNEIQARKAEMPADVAQIYEYSFTHAFENWEQVNPNVFDV